MNYFKTFLMLCALTLLLIFIGHSIGGRTGATWAFGIALIMNFGSYWFSDKIVLRMYGAKRVEASEFPKLHRIIDKLCQLAQIPKPAVYIMSNPTPNAFATGRNPDHAAVAVTDGILQILNDDELEGVLSHELAHIQNRDILISTIAATIAGAIMMIADWARFAAFFGFGRQDDEEGTNPVAIIALAILAPLAAMLIQMAISRSREYLADTSGARMCGKPIGLANALKKLTAGVNAIPMHATPATAHMFIVKPFSGGAIFSLFSTHPPMEKRIAKLEKMLYA